MTISPWLTFLNIKDLTERVETLETDGGGGSATDITYDNSSSGLAAINVQEGVDELSDNIPENAEELVYDNASSGLAATNPQDAIDELSDLIGEFIPKPMAPSTLIGIDVVGGDDTNSGFSGNDVQTLPRVVEILSSYNWNSNNVTVLYKNNAADINSFTSLDFGDVTNANQISLNGDNILTISSTLRIRNFDPTVLITNTDFNSGGSVVTHLLANNGTTLRIDNDNTFTTDFGILISAEDVNFIDVRESTLGSRTINTLVAAIRCGRIRIPTTMVSGSTTGSVANLTDCKVLQFTGVGTVSVTGRAFNITGVSTEVIGSNLINNSVANLYDTSTIIDGDNGIRGAFASDADAGTGGVQTGEYFQSDGLGVAPFDVAGQVFVKQ